MAKHNSKAHMAYVRSFKKGARKHARKSNPWPVAGLVVNPHHKKKRRSTAVARTHHKKRHASYQRNPKLMGLELPPINKVVFAGIGFLAPPMIEGAISQFIPAEVQASTVGKYAVRVGVVLALSYGIRRFIGRDEGNMAAIGGGVYVLSTAAVEFLPNVFGTGTGSTTKGVSAYVMPNRQLAGYVPANQSINNALGMPSAYGTRGQANGAYGGSTAARFLR